MIRVVIACPTCSTGVDVHLPSDSLVTAVAAFNGVHSANGCQEALTDGQDQEEPTAEEDNVHETEVEVIGAPEPLAVKH